MTNSKILIFHSLIFIVIPNFTSLKFLPGLVTLYIASCQEQHMDNAYPGSNILVVTITNGESKRVEAQSDQETKIEAMKVLRDMFGPDIPDAIDILVPRWWNNRFQRGSYSNYPIISNNQLVRDIKVLE